jgi:arsenite methyltransferase
LLNQPLGNFGAKQFCAANQGGVEMEKQQTFFDFAAEVGITKHIGSVEATQALIELCHIGKDTYVLDVGCGVGVTPCSIAKRHGCRVVGVDILEAMVERSKERAKQEGVMDRVEFKIADAQDLPFEDNLFDAVITESVTAFPEDKQKAVQEYARVTKPGGYVGLNESTWLKVPPPPELIAWASQDLGANIGPLTSSEWTELLANAGLSEITTKIFAINLRDEGKGMLRRYGWGGMLSIMGRMLALYATNPAYRKFVKEVRVNEITPTSCDRMAEHILVDRMRIQQLPVRSSIGDAHYRFWQSRDRIPQCERVRWLGGERRRQSIHRSDGHRITDHHNR